MVVSNNKRFVTFSSVYLNIKSNEDLCNIEELKYILERQHFFCKISIERGINCRTIRLNGSEIDRCYFWLCDNKRRIYRLIGRLTTNRVGLFGRLSRNTYYFHLDVEAFGNYIGGSIFLMSDPVIFFSSVLIRNYHPINDICRNLRENDNIELNLNMVETEPTFLFPSILKDKFSISEISQKFTKINLCFLKHLHEIVERYYRRADDKEDFILSMNNFQTIMTNILQSNLETKEINDKIFNVKHGRRLRYNRPFQNKIDIIRCIKNMYKYSNNNQSIISELFAILDSCLIIYLHMKYKKYLSGKMYKHPRALNCCS